MMHSQSSFQSNLLTLAAPPLLLTAVLYTLQHTSTDIASSSLPKLFSRDDEAKCPVDLAAPNACQLIQEQCKDFDSDGLIPYLRFYACAPTSAQPFLLPLMGLWLIVLFASMATAAGEYLAVHLEFIVKTLNINENLAGVTIFAFGNGCTDLFSTLAAMEANSGSLAISELFGAAAFITTVVLGAITLIQPFSVDPRALVADVIWFIIAASLLIAFLADGQLVLGECLGIIGLYAAFVIFAVMRPGSRQSVTLDPTQDAGRPDQSLYGESNTSAGSEEPLINIDSPTEATLGDSSDEAEVTAESIASSQVVGQDSPFLHGLASQTNNAEIDESEDGSAQELDELDLPPNAFLVRTDSHEATQTSKWATLLRSFPPVLSWREQSRGEKVLICFSLPFLGFIGLTTPPCPSAGGNGNVALTSSSPNPAAAAHGGIAAWREHFRDTVISIMHSRLPSMQTLRQNWLLYIQLILGPQLLAAVIITQSSTEGVGYRLLLGGAIALTGSFSLITYVFSGPKPIADTNTYPRGSLVISILAFATSLVWIYLTAASAVTLLMTLALILRIPNALLGATVFAIGQSSNDLVANTAVARRGMPVLAASATFGGPMMNMLLGIGGGGLIQVSKSKANGGSGIYSFKVGPGVFVSAACLVLGLCITLGYTFRNAWRLERGLGATLIGTWIAFTFANVALNIAA